MRLISFVVIFYFFCTIHSSATPYNIANKARFSASFVVGEYDASKAIVPLTQYHGGGAAATLEPLKDHISDYKAHMIQNYGAGVQACYRGPRLYDTPETKAAVVEVIDWYKKYRNVLNSELINLRRADGRDWDGFMHINPEEKEKGFALLFNPTDQAIYSGNNCYNPCSRKYLAGS